MSITRALRMNRKWLTLGLLGLIPLAGGCGEEDKNAKPAAPAQSQAELDKERAAREAAYGKSTIPPGKPGTGGAPPAEKSAEKK